VTPEEHNWVDNTYAGMFLGGSSCGRDVPGGGNSLFSHIDYITTLLEGMHPSVDVTALSAALGPLLHPSTDVNALSAALIPHLPGAPDPVAFAAALAPHIKVTSA
jgi:hypothetical protein